MEPPLDERVEQPAADTGAPELDPVAGRESPRTLLRALDDGTVDGHALLGLHRSIGGDPLRRGPTDEVGSRHDQTVEPGASRHRIS